MNPFSRRRFIKNTALTTLLGAGSSLLSPSARAIQPIKRSGPARFRLSVVAYSFRELFNAKDPAKKIDLFNFIDFASENGFEGVEVTQYYFPKEVTPEYLAQLRSYAASTNRHVVLMRPHSALSVEMRFRYRKRILQIVSIERFDRLSSFLRVTCEEMRS